jgi:DNA-binding NarL/FixJ family response regulator
MRVVLAEDLYLLRTGLEKLLAAHGFDVIEAVDSGPALLDALVRGGGGGAGGGAGRD